MKNVVLLSSLLLAIGSSSASPENIYSIPSPDGTKRVDIVIMQTEAGPLPKTASVVNSKGGVIAKLGSIEYPLGRWSLDGWYFAYHRSDRNHCAQVQWDAAICAGKIYLFSARSNKVEFLTHGESPAFSSKPDRIIFLREFDRSGKKIPARLSEISISTREERDISVFPPTYDFWGEIIDIGRPSEIQVWASVGQPRLTQRGSTEMYEFFVYDREGPKGPIERYRVQLEDDGRYHIGFK